MSVDASIYNLSDIGFQTEPYTSVVTGEIERGIEIVDDHGRKNDIKTRTLRCYACYICKCWRYTNRYPGYSIYMHLRLSMRHAQDMNSSLGQYREG